MIYRKPVELGCFIALLPTKQARKGKRGELLLAVYQASKLLNRQRATAIARTREPAGKSTFTDYPSIT